jgi:ubiquitin C-terminal hydrolase
MVWQQHMMESGSKIVEIFRGMNVSRTYCEKCEDAKVIYLICPCRTRVVVLDDNHCSGHCWNSNKLLCCT